MEYYHLFMDHFLYELDNGAVEDIPEVNIASNNSLNWESYDTWPIAGSETEKWYLNAPGADKAGAFTPAAPPAGEAGTFKDDYDTNKTMFGDRVPGVDLINSRVLNSHLNGWEDRLFNPANLDMPSTERLAFATDPLEEPLRINGTVTVGLELAVDKGWGSISAVLLEVGPNYRSFGTASVMDEETGVAKVLDYGGKVDLDDFSTGTTPLRTAAVINNYTITDALTQYKIVTRGYGDVQNPNPDKVTYLNAKHDEGYISPYYYQTQTITPGEKNKYYFVMEPMDYTFKAGTRLALYVYSTDYRTTLIPINPPAFTLYAGKNTFVELPIVPTCSISYDANGGESLYEALGGYSDAYPIAGQSELAWDKGYRVVSAAVAKLSRSGYNFNGWNTKADGSGTAYAPGERIADADMGAITLYAQWSRIPVYNYTVSFRSSQTTISAGNTLTVDILLSGDINYTQIMAVIDYDPSLLQYTGYTNLSGVIAICAPVSPGKVTLRSVPSSNLITGVPCGETRCFVDSNIWVYSFARDDDPRGAAAKEFIGSASASTIFFISYQVINETIRVLKKCGFTEQELRQIIDSMFAICEICAFTKASAYLASDLRETMPVSYWDSHIVANALLAGCNTLVSEDFQNNAFIRGIQVKNIFKKA
jgi:uncharacterized repeat protein (TIGR02543 family)